MIQTGFQEQDIAKIIHAINDFHDILCYQDLPFEPFESFNLFSFLSQILITAPPSEKLIKSVLNLLEQITRRKKIRTLQLLEQSDLCMTLLCTINYEDTFNTAWIYLILSKLCRISKDISNFFLQDQHIENIKQLLIDEKLTKEAKKNVMEILYQISKRKLSSLDIQKVGSIASSTISLPFLQFLWRPALIVLNNLITDKSSTFNILVGLNMLKVANDLLQLNDPLFNDGSLYLIGTYFQYFSEAPDFIDYARIIQLSYSTDEKIVYPVFWSLSNILASGSEFVTLLSGLGIYGALKHVFETATDPDCLYSAVDCVNSIISHGTTEQIEKCIHMNFINSLLEIGCTDADEDRIQNIAESVIQILSTGSNSRLLAIEQFLSQGGHEFLSYLSETENHSVFARRIEKNLDKARK